MSTSLELKEIEKHPEHFVYESVLWEIKDYVLLLSLNRADKKNAINASMAREIVYLLSYAKQSDDIRVVNISAQGDVFSAGGDLSAMRGDKQESRSTVPSLSLLPDSPNADLNLIAIALRRLNKPSIVEVKGSVFAGALLIICNATHVYATKGCRFSAPEIHRGLWPYMVMAGLFRLVPKRKALDWIMEGRAIDAVKAESWGLINQALDEEKLDACVKEKIAVFRNLPPKTMSLGLQAFNEQDSMSFDAALPLLAGMLEKTLKEGDAEEGISAFLGKRKASWVLE